MSEVEVLIIKVILKSAKSEVIGWEDGVLKVRLNAVAEKGSANDVLIKVLAKHYKLPKSHFTLTKGQKSRLKTIQMEKSRKFQEKES